MPRAFAISRRETVRWYTLWTGLPAGPFIVRISSKIVSSAVTDCTVVKNCQSGVPMLCMT